jgi:FtsZ-binding cell division protein ZapB
MQDTTESPYVRLNRLAQDHSRRQHAVNDLAREIEVLEDQLKKKRNEWQETVNIKVGIEAKMKATALELT